VQLVKRVSLAALVHEEQMDSKDLLEQQEKLASLERLVAKGLLDRQVRRV